jgi:hypothetical protein
MGTKFLFLGEWSGCLTLVEGFKVWKLSVMGAAYEGEDDGKNGKELLEIVVLQSSRY